MARLTKKNQGGELALADGVVLLTGDAAQDVSFPNLATAVLELISVSQGIEHNRFRAGRILHAISNQELYKEQGYKDFKSFLADIVSRTNGIGIKSGTTAKRYLALYRLYILSLGYREELAVKAVSHLNELYPLAYVKNGELADPQDKPGKLNPVAFDDVSRLVLFLVSAEAQPVREALPTGLSAEELHPILEANGLVSAANLYQELTGHAVALPQKGWKLEHTREIIDAVKPEPEEGEEDSGALTQVFFGYETHDGAIHIERIEFRDSEGEAKATIPVGETYSTTVFKQMVKGHKAQIAGVDGEQAEDE